VKSPLDDYKSMQFVNLLSFLFNVKQNYSKGKVMLDHLWSSRGLGSELEFSFSAPIEVNMCQEDLEEGG
jgi:hypothetical protein